MPIYAYRCSTCGHAKDVLQKMSDAVLTDCPACGASTYVKQVTAAGFQLKGSGWYVTDFKGDNKPAPTAADAAKPEATKSDAGKTDSSATAASGTAKSESASAPAVAAPAASPAPAAPGAGAK